MNGRKLGRTVAVVVVAGLALVAVPRPAGAAVAGPVRLVSHVPGSQTTTSGHHNFSHVASENGAYVAFVSRAGNLMAGQFDGNADLDV